MGYIAGKSRYLQKITGVRELYEKISGHFGTMQEIAPFRGPQAAGIDKKRIPEMINLVKECRDLEESAVAEIKKVLETE